MVGRATPRAVLSLVLRDHGFKARRSAPTPRRPPPASRPRHPRALRRQCRARPAVEFGPEDPHIDIRVGDVGITSYFAQNVGRDATSRPFDLQRHAGPRREVFREGRLLHFTDQRSRRARAADAGRVSTSTWRSSTIRGPTTSPDHAVLHVLRAGRADGVGGSAPRPIERTESPEGTEQCLDDVKPRLSSGEPWPVAPIGSSRRVHAGGRRGPS